MAGTAGDRGRLAGDGLDETTAELGAEQAVDDEVDARVDVHQQLGGRLKVEHDVAAAVSQSNQTQLSFTANETDKTSGAVLGKNIGGGAGPSSFRRQQRLSEITIEAITSTSSRTTVSNCPVLIWGAGQDFGGGGAVLPWLEPPLQNVQHGIQWQHNAAHYY